MSASHLLEVWRRIPIGTSVSVRRADGTRFETRTASGAFEVCGTAVIRVVSLDATDYYALDRVSLTGVPASSLAVTIADAIEPPPPDVKPTFFDRPEVTYGAIVVMFLVLGASIVARLIEERHVYPGFVCDEFGVCGEYEVRP